MLNLVMLNQDTNNPWANLSINPNQVTNLNQVMLNLAMLNLNLAMLNLVMLNPDILNPNLAILNPLLLKRRRRVLIDSTVEMVSSSSKRWNGPK